MVAHQSTSADNCFGDAPGHVRLYNQLEAFGQHGQEREDDEWRKNWKQVH